MSIFQEHWWLDAVAPDEWREVVVYRGGTLVGRWPFCLYTRFRVPVIGMAPLTPTMGPWIAEMKGNAFARTYAEIEIIRKLSAQLPRHGFFRQILSPTVSNVLAYQIGNFSIGLEHTIQIDWREDIETIWRSMKGSLRNQIRTGERKGTISQYEDIEEFIDLHKRAMLYRKLKDRLDSKSLARLYEACRLREAVTLLAYRDANKRLAASLCCVHANGRMHHFVQTRHPGAASSGAMDALTWRAIQIAHANRLIYDLDGLPNRASAKRQIKFGGSLANRFIITSGNPLLLGLRQTMKSYMSNRGRARRFC